MRVRRSREIRAPREQIWEIVADPWQLPRWWPRTDRVEGVTGSDWTSILGSDRGRSVRADWSVVVTRRPERRRWRQELEGTPFARLFAAHEVEVELEGQTRVSITIEQALRGWTRLAPFLVRRAARRQADEALAGLAALVEPA